jgi:hypothetical protein
MLPDNFHVQMRGGARPSPALVKNLSNRYAEKHGRPEQQGPPYHPDDATYASVCIAEECLELLSTRAPLLQDLRQLAQHPQQAYGWGEVHDRYERAIGALIRSAGAAGRSSSGAEASSGASSSNSCAALYQRLAWGSSSTGTTNTTTTGIATPSLSPATCLTLEYRSAKKLVLWDFLLACDPHVLQLAAAARQSSSARL